MEETMDVGRSAVTWAEAKEEGELITVCTRRPQGKIVIKDENFADFIAWTAFINRPNFINKRYLIDQYAVPQHSSSPNARACLHKLILWEIKNVNVDLLNEVVDRQIITVGEASRYKNLTKGSGRKYRLNVNHPDFDEDAFNFRNEINEFIRIRPKMTKMRMRNFSSPFL